VSQCDEHACSSGQTANEDLVVAFALDLIVAKGWLVGEADEQLVSEQHHIHQTNATVRFTDGLPDDKLAACAGGCCGADRPNAGRGAGGRVARRLWENRLWENPPMLLYTNQLSGNCYKVRLLFAQLGLDYETREVDVFDRSWRRELLGGLNPALRVPTLVLDDDRALAESNAILCYFAEGTPYLPEDRFERAQVLQWLFFEQYSHEPFLAVARFWALAGITPPDVEREAKMRGGTAALMAMDRHLAARLFLVAERYTIADIALFAYTHMAPEGGFELEPYRGVRAWLERVTGQPDYVPITSA